MRKSNKKGLEALKKVLVVLIIGTMLFSNAMSPIKALDTLEENPVEEQSEDVEEVSEEAEESAEEAFEEEPEAPVEETEEPASEEEAPVEEAPEEELPEEEIPEEEAPAEETSDEPIEEVTEEVDYPEAYFEDNTGVVSIIVNAPEGAFPEGTTMQVKTVNSKAVEKIAEGLVDDSTGRTHAVDITFYNADGDKIEPLVPINVSMSAADIADENAVIVHMPNDGGWEVIDTEVAEEGVAFESDAFSVYVVVETGVDARLSVKFVKADGSEITEMINQR